jgi:hypothetical protein
LYKEDIYFQVNLNVTAPNDFHNIYVIKALHLIFSNNNFRQSFINIFLETVKYAFLATGKYGHDLKELGYEVIENCFVQRAIRPKLLRTLIREHNTLVRQCKSINPEYRAKRSFNLDSNQQTHINHVDNMKPSAPIIINSSSTINDNRTRLNVKLRLSRSLTKTELV